MVWMGEREGCVRERRKVGMDERGGARAWG
jgi:hypothetical protein